MQFRKPRDAAPQARGMSSQEATAGMTAMITSVLKRSRRTMLLHLHNCPAHFLPCMSIVAQLQHLCRQAEPGTSLMRGGAALAWVRSHSTVGVCKRERERVCVFEAEVLEIPWPC